MNPPLSRPQITVTAPISPGRPAKTGSDPERQAFITARTDRMTFHQVADDAADDIADHFPPERRARKSAIHAWWQRTKDRK